MSCSVDKTIRIWNYETYELLQILYGHSDWVLALVHIVNTKLIVSGGRDSLIKIWNYETY